MNCPDCDQPIGIREYYLRGCSNCQPKIDLVKKALKVGGQIILNRNLQPIYDYNSYAPIDFVTKGLEITVRHGFGREESVINPPHTAIRMIERHIKVRFKKDVKIN